MIYNVWMTLFSWVNTMWCFQSIIYGTTRYGLTRSNDLPRHMWGCTTALFNPSILLACLWGQKWFSPNGVLKLSPALSLALAVFLWQRLNEMNGLSKGPALLCHCCIIHLVSQGDLQIRTFRALIHLFLLSIYPSSYFLCLAGCWGTHFLDTVNTWTTFQKCVDVIFTAKLMMSHSNKVSSESLAKNVACRLSHRAYRYEFSE